MTKFATTIDNKIPAISKTGNDSISVKHYLAMDEKSKKSTIYHYPMSSTADTNKEYEKRNKKSDTTSWKVGIPMSFEDFIRMPSDDSRKIYLQSIFDKYEGLSISSITYMFKFVSISFVRKMIEDLGIEKCDTEKRRYGKNKIDKQFRADVDKCFNDPEYKNLEIDRRKALPNLPRYTYDEMMKMSGQRQRIYLKNLMDRYYGIVRGSSLAEFFKCSPASVSRLIKKTGYKYDNGCLSSLNHSDFADVIDNRFREEMITKRCSFPSKKISISNANEIIEVKDISTNSNPVASIEKIPIPRNVDVKPIEPIVVGAKPVNDAQVVEDKTEKIGSFKSLIDETMKDHPSKSIEDTNTNVPAFSDLGAYVSNIEFNTTIGESIIFSDTFKKAITNMFGDKTTIKITIEKMY